MKESNYSAFDDAYRAVAYFKARASYAQTFYRPYYSQKLEEAYQRLNEVQAKLRAKHECARYDQYQATIHRILQCYDIYVVSRPRKELLRTPKTGVTSFPAVSSPIWHRAAAPQGTTRLCANNDFRQRPTSAKVGFSAHFACKQGFEPFKAASGPRSSFSGPNDFY